MTYFDEVFNRIKQATNRSTQVDLAALLEIRQSSISDAKRRNSVPPHWILTLYQKFGLNPDWITHGKGPMYLRTTAGYETADAPGFGAVHEDFSAYAADYNRPVGVKVYSSANRNGEVALTCVEQLTIPLPMDKEGLLVLRVDSVSMEPYIRKGAFVGIDTKDKRLASGEFFGVVLPHEGHVIKKVFVDANNGTLVLRSGNTEVPDQTLPLENYEKFIAGRVLWVMQSYS